MGAGHYTLRDGLRGDALPQSEHAGAHPQDQRRSLQGESAGPRPGNLYRDGPLPPRMPPVNRGEQDLIRSALRASLRP